MKRHQKGNIIVQNMKKGRNMDKSRNTKRIFPVFVAIILLLSLIRSF